MISSSRIIFFLNVLFLSSFPLFFAEASEFCFNFYNQKSTYKEAPDRALETSSVNNEDHLQLQKLHDALIEINDLKTASSRLRSKQKKYDMKLKLSGKFENAIYEYRSYLDLMIAEQVKYNESFLLDFYNILVQFSHEISPFNQSQLRMLDHLFLKVFGYSLTKNNIQYRIRETKNGYGMVRSEIQIFGGNTNEFSSFIEKIRISLGLKTVLSPYKLNGFTSAVDQENQIYYINLKSIFEFKGNETVAHEMFHAKNALKRKKNESFLEDGIFYDQSNYSGPYKNFWLEELRAYDISARVTITQLLKDRSETKLQRLKGLVNINLSLAKRSKTILRELIKQLKKGEDSVMLFEYAQSLLISSSQFAIGIPDLKDAKIPKEKLMQILSDKLKFAHNHVQVYNSLHKDLKNITSAKDIDDALPAIQLFRNSYPSKI